MLIINYNFIIHVSADKIIFTYANEGFIVSVVCLGTNKDWNKCEDYTVLYW